MKKVGLHDPTTQVHDPTTGLTPADLRTAALAVCDNAHDVDEAREFLAMLGLLEEVTPNGLT